MAVVRPAHLVDALSIQKPVVEHGDGRELTFAAFDTRAERCAAALERLGLSTRERVAILCHNTTTFFEILFGCGKARLILVPLNWRQTPAELTPILADCGARILIHDDATAELPSVRPVEEANGESDAPARMEFACPCGAKLIATRATYDKHSRCSSCQTVLLLNLVYDADQGTHEIVPFRIDPKSPL